MPSREDVRTALTAFAKTVMQRKDLVKNEEQTKTALVLPFLSLLGYDVSNPLEVAAEHGADFSDKYKNKVDYAILRDGHPVIAVECKSVGRSTKDDLGQLKSYFNAAKTVRVGLLTDGVAYVFFVDSSSPNLMDDTPYLTLDFGAVAEGNLPEAAVDQICDITKEGLKPDEITANARKALVYNAFYEYLRGQFAEPSEEFTRFLLQRVNVKHIHRSNIEPYRLLAKKAFSEMFKAHVRERLEFQAPKPVDDAAAQAKPQEAEVAEDPAIVTTQAELDAFTAIRMRLAFLVAKHDEALYSRLDEIKYQDFAGKFVIFYGKRNKGRLVDVIEGRDGALRFIMCDGMPDAEVSDPTQFDMRLLELFRKRVAEVKA